MVYPSGMRRFALVTLAISACTLFPELSGLTGAEGDASIDALGDALVADVGTSDVADSSQTTDGPTEASTDATDAGVISDASFCGANPGHTFCEDFEPPNFQARWDGIVVNNGGTVVQNNTTSVSPPSSMLASLTYAANSTGHAYATKHFATASKTIKVRSQMLVDPTTIAQIDPLMISFNPAPAGYTAYEIHIDTGTSHLGCQATPSDGGAVVHQDEVFSNPLSTWHNVEVDVDMVASTVTFLVDGVAANP
jgi:hypothetical protein